MTITYLDKFKVVRNTLNYNIVYKNETNAVTTYFYGLPPEFNESAEGIVAITKMYDEYRFTPIFIINNNAYEQDYDRSMHGLVMRKLSEHEFTALQSQIDWLMNMI